MPKTEVEARDAYLAVEISLPNGTTVRGKPVPYIEAMKLLALSEQWENGEASLAPLLTRFHELTGITPESMADCSLGEAVDVMRTFFFRRRPAPAATQGNGGDPSGS